MQEYLTYLDHILTHGVTKTDRTNIGTIGVFGYQMRFDLQQGFPIITTKKVHWASVVHELLWFLRGDTNISYLRDNGITIWNEWADADGNLGPIYGHQWRSWPMYDGTSYDQITAVLASIKNDPNSRRMIINAWNVGQLAEMKLPPCHLLFQFYVADNKLSCQLYQRSADSFLGVPFNISSYALLTHMLAQQANLGVGEFIWTGGDCHIYLNHIKQVKTQLERQPYPLPKLVLNHEVPSIFAYQFNDIILQDYQHHPALSGKVAV